jgi:hypothetical protein
MSVLCVWTVCPPFITSQRSYVPEQVGPLCRLQIKSSELVEFPQEENNLSENWRSSSKVEALMQGYPTLFLESDRPIGYHSNTNLAHLIVIISWLIS